MANPRTPETARNRILRRGFNFSRGFDAAGRLDQGLAFVSYQRSLANGFLAVQARLKGEPLEEYILPVGAASSSPCPASPPGTPGWASGCSTSTERRYRLVGARPSSPPTGLPWRLPWPCRSAGVPCCSASRSRPCRCSPAAGPPATPAARRREHLEHAGGTHDMESAAVEPIELPAGAKAPRLP